MNLHICIPLKSKKVSNFWLKDCMALKNVFDSIFYQKNTNINPIIYLVCNDVPKFINNYKFSSNINIIQLELNEIPLTPQDKNKDKQLKKKIAINKIADKAKEGDLLAIFDADDLCHADLLNEIESKLKNNTNTDFIFYTGYMYNRDTNDFAYIDGVNNIFYKICGSCIISKILSEDISNSLEFFYKLSNHTKFYEICESNGRKPQKFTFPAMLYMHDSVNNLSSGNVYIRNMFQTLHCNSTHHLVNLMKYFSSYSKVNENLFIVEEKAKKGKEVIFENSNFFG